MLNSERDVLSAALVRLWKSDFGLVFLLCVLLFADFKFIDFVYL